MKRFALMLVVIGSACKTTDSAPKPQPSEPAPVTHKRERGPAPSLGPEAPVAAAPEADGSGSDQVEPPPGFGDFGRKHREHRANMDTDGDGKISDAERAAARKQRSEQMRTRLDTNGDGKLTVDELTNAQGRMKFDDPAALDTNRDGDISATELEAGMAARREQLRAQRDQERDPANSAGSAGSANEP